MKDLFEHYEEQPPALKKICDKWQEKQASEGLTYKDCENYLKEVEAIGYTFESGLDAEPFNLQKSEFYFKFVVPDSYEHEYKSYKKAVKKATKLNEKVYLCIYSRKNTFKEIYDEEIINNANDINQAKEKLIKSFKNLIES